jgi:hypothetical protein
VITIEQVHEAMKKAVQEKGEDYTYVQYGGECYYRHPDTKEKSCLIGHVLVEVGVESTLIDALERFSIGAILSEARPPFALPLREVFDKRTIYAMNVAQESQDQGSPWGDALADFEAAMSNDHSEEAMNDD